MGISIEGPVADELLGDSGHLGGADDVGRGRGGGGGGRGRGGRGRGRGRRGWGGYYDQGFGPYYEPIPLFYDEEDDRGRYGAVHFVQG